MITVMVYCQCRLSGVEVNHFHGSSWIVTRRLLPIIDPTDYHQHAFTNPVQSSGVKSSFHLLIMLTLADTEMCDSDVFYH